MIAPVKSSNIAAIFDVDGTLIPAPSLERRFFQAMQQSGVIPPVNYLRWLVEGLRLLPRGITAIQQENKKYLADLRPDLLFQYVEGVSLFEEAVGRVAWHCQQGHEIVLVSGTLEPLAWIVATSLECEIEARGLTSRVHVLATRLEEQNGHWTGRVLGDVLFAEHKNGAVFQFAAEGHVDLRESHAYGNSSDDRFLLAAVGHPHVVNPGKALAALAKLRDWPISYWQHAKGAPLAGTSPSEARIKPIESGV